MLIGAIFTGLFLMVFVPVLFFMVIWAIVTALRICLPERDGPPVWNETMLRRTAAARGAHVPVGFQEIREDQRHQHLDTDETPYHYFQGEPSVFPVEWIEDVRRRCN